MSKRRMTINREKEQEHVTALLMYCRRGLPVETVMGEILIPLHNDPDDSVNVYNVSKDAEELHHMNTEVFLLNSHVSISRIKKVESL